MTSGGPNRCTDPVTSTNASSIEMRCGKIPLFRGNMGRKGNGIAIRIDKKVRRMASSGGA